MSEGARILHIEAKNAFGISEVSFSPGQITQISAQNGGGKSSIINSILETLKGGNNPSLLNADAKSGEVVIHLSDDVVITRKFTRKSNTLKITKGGEVIKKPQHFLEKEYLSSLKCNPMLLLTASKAERTRLFLSTLPVNVDHMYVSSLVDRSVTKTNDEHGIVFLDRIRTEQFQERTTVNRLLKQSEQTIKTLTESLPVDLVDTSALDTSIDSLNARRENILKSKAVKISGHESSESKIKSDFGNQVVALNHGLSEMESEKAGLIREVNSEEAGLIREVDVELENKIQLLKSDAAMKKNNIKSDAVMKITQVNERFSDRKNKLESGIESHKKDMAHALATNAQKFDSEMESYESSLREIISELNSLKSERELADGQRITQRLITSNETEAAKYRGVSDRLSLSVNNLDGYKAEMLAEFDLEGFDYREGDVYIDGVKFDAVNTARLIEVSVDLARLQSPKLNFVCVDGAEALDSNNYKRLIDKCLSYNMTMFMTKVSDDAELKIENVA